MVMNSTSTQMSILLCISQGCEGPYTSRTLSANYELCFTVALHHRRVSFLSYSKDLQYTTFKLAAGQVLPLIPPVISTLSIAALIEDGHRLVCRTDLKLHEVGTGMFAVWTWLCSRVHILPGSCSTKHIIYFF